jgi:hypothetical protein
MELTNHPRTTAPTGYNYEKPVHLGLVSYSARAPSVDGLPGDSIRTVADTVDSFSGLR